MVSVVKSNPEGVAALQKCERQFCCALSSFLSENPHVKRWVIAHSGGLDSQLLLHLAAKKIPSTSLLVLHINHHLQTSSRRWAEFSLTQSHQLSLHHQSIDVYPASQSENSAREARYEAFEGVIESGDCLLMGHHADDQAETVLFRMLRGSGLAGMSGIAPSRTLGQGRLLRPLLQLSRLDLERAVSESGIEYIDDPSNVDESYDRNYLRHQIIPVLKKRWPNMLDRWGKNAQLFSQSNQLLESYLDADLSDLVDEQRLCLDIERLLQFDELRGFALLRHWLYKKTNMRANQKQLETVFSDVLKAQLDANPIYRIGQYDLRRFLGQLYIVKLREKEGEDCKRETQISGEGEYRLTGGLLRVQSASLGLKESAGLIVRYRRGGERCRPAGKNHSISVKKLLQEAAVPTWLREHWPLLYMGEELVAVPGICICEGWYTEKSGFSLLWHPF